MATIEMTVLQADLFLFSLFVFAPKNINTFSDT
jgi:hypothetical protein